MHQQAIHDYFADKEALLIASVSRLVRIDLSLIHI